jgi:hypothetical protein
MASLHTRAEEYAQLLAFGALEHCALGRLSVQSSRPGVRSIVIQTQDFYNGSAGAEMQLIINC